MKHLKPHLKETSGKPSNKVILSIVAAFGVVGAVVIAFSKAATLSASFTLSPSSGSYAINSNFTVAIYENSGTQAVNGVNLGLIFDKTKSG